jgi:hypothetical protein
MMTREDSGSVTAGSTPYPIRVPQPQSYQRSLSKTRFPRTLIYTTRPLIPSSTLLLFRSLLFRQPSVNPSFFATLNYLHCSIVVVGIGHHLCYLK